MLDAKAIKAIESILASGLDVEIRKNRYGVTIAAVSKKVVYKESDNGESVQKPK